jgi:Ca2+-transporting ATPase
VVRPGLLIGSLALGLGVGYFYADLASWQTMVFTTLAFAQVGQALAARSEVESLRARGFKGNPLITTLLAVVVALQLAVVYTPGLNEFFGVQALSPLDLGVAAAAGGLVLTALEAAKAARR